jgi:phthiocerol/phenolphthiocerol synthesis type-I polyketide synthase E
MKTEVQDEQQKPIAAATTDRDRDEGAANRTTARLTRIWQQLLGVESVGPDENYFDLGGDSILAVQLFAEIEQVFKMKLPVATLFEAPTIHELARVLGSQEAPSSGWSPLVTIQPLGSRPPFFCMHGAGGNVLVYRDLARHLGNEQPFFGLQCRGLDGSLPPLTRVEEMAALYVKEIRHARPQGPYLLGGYCGGGTIALEVAQQLRAAGEQIALLALFDTMNWSKIPPMSAWNKTYQYSERLVFHAANFFTLDSSGKAQFLREKLKGVRQRLPVWRGMLLARWKTGAPGKSESRLLGEIWSTNDRACTNYIPRAYPGVITDFRPIQQYRLFNKPDAKWDQIAQGGQEVVALPVYPAGMLVEPFVQHLAAALRNCIDKAICEYNPV